MHLSSIVSFSIRVEDVYFDYAIFVIRKKRNGIILNIVTSPAADIFTVTASPDMGVNLYDAMYAETYLADAYSIRQH